MQLPHVFIAFLAREVRFSHGFIAFLLFVFLGVPRWPPRAIFCDFGPPLGASWGYLGAILAPYWLQLGHLGSILELSWAMLSSLRIHVGASLVILGPCWLHLGFNLSILARSWRSLWPW